MSDTDTAPRATGSTAPATWRRVINPKIVVLLVVFLVIWQLASMVTASYNVPKIVDVGEAMLAIVTQWDDGLENLVTTLIRVGVGLVFSFVVGLGLGLAAGTSRSLSGYLLPVIRFVQGIPSLSWVIIAVIWFADVEARVLFVMVLVTLPGFALQAYDSYRAIPTELRDMAHSFRPSRLLMFREVTLPSITPGLFTAWKVNLGLGIRMVLIAELVGATVGVGSQLLSAQQLFDMAAVVAWTLLLAICMLALQSLTEVIESYALRYRAAPATTGPNAPDATTAPAAQAIAGKG